jgi:hypothetical protein
VSGGDQDSGPGHQAGAIDRLAALLDEDGGLERLEEDLALVDPMKLDPVERERWYHLRGVVPLRQGDHALALERFVEAAMRCPDSGPIRFSLGQEHEFRGEPDRMLECFDGAVFPAVPAVYAMAQARYAYLWGRPDRGRAYVEALLPVYLELRVLDPAFLDMRGLPFFEEVWSALAAFSHLEGRFAGLESFTRRVLAGCSDFDAGRLEAELAWVMTGDSERLVKRLQDSLRKAGRKGWPCGLEAMRLATLEARRLGWSGDARRLLETAALGEQDFPWLEDVRLLALAAAARQSGDAAAESELRRRFLAAQPMLLEPWHALTFGLLDYQGSMLEEYTSRRRPYSQD